MKLIRLELENFRQHLSTAIDFEDGVTGIIGTNGAGKTTILEGIAWALYGSPALRGNNDFVRSKAAPGGAKAMVSLSFELGGAQYRATRALDASKTGHAMLEVEGRPLKTGTKEVNAAIAHLLGMDYQAFFTSFFTGQKQLEFMSALEGRARAAAIGRMLGYDRLTKARDQANADRLGLAREIEGLERGLPDHEELKQRKRNAHGVLSEAKTRLESAEAAVKTAQESVERLRPLKEASDQKSKRRDEISRRLEIDRADVARAESRLTDLAGDIKSLTAKRTEFEELKTKASKRLSDAGFHNLKELGEELSKLAELFRYEGDRQRLTGQISALEADIKGLTAREKSLDGANDAQVRAQAAVETAEAMLAETDKKLQASREARIAAQHSLDAQISQLTEQGRVLAAKRQQIAEAGADGKCPTCERPLADELATVLANFDSQTREVESRIAGLKAEKTKLQADDGGVAELEKTRTSVSTQLDGLRKEKSAADAKIAELYNVRRDLSARSNKLDGLKADLAKLPSGFDQSRYRDLQDLKESLQPDRERAASLHGEVERLPKVETESTELAHQVQAKKHEITESEKTLAEIGFSERDHERLSKDFDAAFAQQNAALLAVERERGEVNTAGAILGQIEREDEALKAKLQGLVVKRAERLHLQTLAEAFDKLRAELNDRIRPELESIASELLSDMTDGRYSTLEISDGYSAMIRDDGELKPVISGGEDDIVNLALRLSVSQMIADRAGQSFSLLVLDEVFGSLDDTRRDNVVALLQNLKNRFEQIIIITHIESIHDAVDNCIWVAFDEKTKTSRLVDRSTDVSAIPAGASP